MRGKTLKAQSQCSCAIAPGVLRQVTQYISDHIGENITLAEVAAQAEMNQYHFARTFKRATGVAPHQYIVQRRVELARQLLGETELPLGDICFRTGLKDQSSFVKLFRSRASGLPTASGKNKGRAEKRIQS